MKKLILTLFFLLSLIAYPQADLTIEILLHDSGIPPYGGSELLTFGIDSTATDGVDPQLGEYPIGPDICPSWFSDFCSTFILPDNNSTYLDFRYGTLPYTGQKAHKIYVWTVDSSYFIDYNFPSGITVNLIDQLGGLFFSATIEDSGQIEIPYEPSVIMNKIWMNVIYDNVIPVELTSFTASVLENERAIQLNWSTATETNNSGFEVERLQDYKIEKLQEWETIGFVPGFGTTTEPKSYSFIDENVTTGTYNYRLKQIDFDGSFEYSNEIEVVVDFTPKEFVLYQNYPNPFNPSTVITFEIPGQARNDNVLVTLKVYDVLGNEVATLVNEEKQPGVYEVEFNASSLASGMYLYKLQAGSPKGQAFIQTKKMILVK